MKRKFIHKKLLNSLLCIKNTPQILVLPNIQGASHILINVLQILLVTKHRYRSFQPHFKFAFSCLKYPFKHTIPFFKISVF